MLTTKRKNHKNLRNFTRHKASYSMRDCGFVVMTIIVLLMFLNTLAEQESSNERRIESRTRRDYKDDYRENVSCIAHDVKFSCDCQNANKIMQLPHLFGFVYQIEISNCKSLQIDANSLENTQDLRKITFKNITNLRLQKNALTFPRYASNIPLIIEFEQVHFELISSHAINGNIEEISFIGGQIDTIHPFGFTTLRDRAILLKMDNVLVKRLEPQAFKKFAIEQMEITNCIFAANLPSKAFYELEVLHMLRLNNVRFQEVHSRAFSFKLLSKLSITKNHFQGVAAEWLEAHVRESAVIRDNFFGATTQISFKGITVHRDYLESEKLELHFANNTVRFPKTAPPRPIDFSERFRINIEQLRYENPYSCKDLNTNSMPPQPREEFFIKFSDKILFQRSSDDNQSYLTLSKLIELNCSQQSYLLYIILGVLALFLVVLLTALIVWICISKKNKRRKVDVVLPEARTYKETQIVYQIENAGLLKTDL